MLLSCLKCLRAHEDVKVLTSTEEWDRHGEDARDGEVALEVVTEHGDIEGASALAELHIEGLLRDWPDADDPRAAGFYMAVYSRERVSDAESNVEEHVDQVDADLEACTQSLRLAEIGSFGEDLDTAVAALDDWHMCEK
ncbi:uncharacterized protein BDW47DRAFT_111282 [Aspergillus candidus]|uniref:Uncharacterized protein n=1 Tax=Aspergillus candidus TaxID=41067 RepID=A0A2I2F2T8_ASPCN|nr:hypothetical protein BDW47DRAFT_111282 [Aspergillus candidus]PLB34919.1 hypothetical protein BDW47DRAFT_111282 [Aspergillus candidus]